MRSEKRCPDGFAIGLCVVPGCEHNPAEVLTIEAPEWFPSVGVEFACIRARVKAERAAKERPTRSGQRQTDRVGLAVASFEAQ